MPSDSTFSTVLEQLFPLIFESINSTTKQTKTANKVAELGSAT